MASDRGLASLLGDVPGLASNWEFVTSEPGLSLRIRRAIRPYLRGRRAPAYQALKPLRPRDQWFVYFVFAPDGRLSAAHRFTLARLRDMGRGVFVVCASARAEAVSSELFDLADALYWKATPGYDFSAYALALGAVAEHSPGADVFVLNDSVYGPFADLRPFVDRTEWGFTGLTASSLHENHIQSYAFIVRDMNPERLEHLRPALPRAFAYDRADDVILCQELYLARVASLHMAVGACWYSNFEQVGDPTLVKPLELLDGGFPFMKKSVFGKHVKFQAHALDDLRMRLADAGHPAV